MGIAVAAFFRRCSTMVAELGWFNSVLYSLDRLLNGISANLSLQAYYLVAQPIPLQPLLPPGRGGNLEVKMVSHDDPRIHSFPRSSEEIHSRYNQGAICFAAFKRDEFYGYLWLLRGRYYEKADHCYLIPHPEGITAWDFDVYVNPSERLGFTFARLWDEAFGYLREHNIRWTMSRVSAFNPASMASHRRLGARFLGHTVFIRAGRWQLMFATLAPFIHFSTTPACSPTIYVRAPEQADI